MCNPPYYKIIDLTPLPADTASVIWTVTGTVTYIELETGKIKITGGAGSVSVKVIKLNGCEIDKGIVAVEQCDMQISAGSVNCITVDGVYYDNILISYTNPLGNPTQLTIYENQAIVFDQLFGASGIINYQLSIADGRTLIIRTTDSVTGCYNEVIYATAICPPSVDCDACTIGTEHVTSNIIPSGGGCNGGFDIEMTNVPSGCEWIITSIRNNALVPTQFYPNNTSSCNSFTLTTLATNKYRISNAPAGSYMIDWQLNGDTSCTQYTLRLNLIP